MKKKFEAKNSLFNVCLVAVCSFVGVGFISGAEIWFYFARFGKIGLLFGVFVFGLLIFVLSGFAFREKQENDLKLNRVKTKILIVSELAVASAMVSGLMQTTRTFFEKWWILVFVSSILLLIILFFSEKKSFVIYNYFVAIFVVFVIVSLFCFNNNNIGQNGVVLQRNFSIKNVVLSILFACIYVFMNVSEIRPILEKNKDKFSKKEKIISSFCLSGILVLLVFMLSIVLLKNNDITKYDMPFLICFKTGGGVKLFVFLIGLVLTMISTADACLIGVKDKLSFIKKDENFIKIIVILSSLILGQISFRFFIKIVYPILAILNFLVFMFEVFEMRNICKIKNIKK